MKSGEAKMHVEERSGRRVVRVVAPSRIHFGMLSLNQPGRRRYGGVGAMVGAPGLEITISPAKQFEAIGPLRDRVIHAAWLAIAAILSDGRGAPARDAGFPDLPCRVEVVRAPPLHVGLGTGTQLAMAVAAGLNAWLDFPPMPPAQLARCVGRGRRSAVGLYGFVYGGLLYEAGKLDEEEIAPLEARVEIPSVWRFVLARPRELRGLSDEAERRAFEELPPVPDQRTESLRREALEGMFPAAASGRYEDFCESLFQFGQAAGSNFAAAQGGPFAGPRLAALVEWLRGQGIRGVGQSSWGPTVFAVVPNETAASELLGRLSARPDGKDLELIVAPPNNQGAEIQIASGQRRSVFASNPRSQPVDAACPPPRNTSG